MCPSARLIATTITPNAWRKFASRSVRPTNCAVSLISICSAARSSRSDVVASRMKSTTAGRSAVAAICKRFDADYWRTRDRDGGFPLDFHAAFAKAGWLGIAMPTEVGGAGLGITEAAIMMRTISGSGAGMSGAIPHAIPDPLRHPLAGQAIRSSSGLKTGGD